MYFWNLLKIKTIIFTNEVVEVRQVYRRSIGSELAVAMAAHCLNPYLAYTNAYL